MFLRKRLLSPSRGLNEPLLLTTTAGACGRRRSRGRNFLVWFGFRGNPRRLHFFRGSSVLPSIRRWYCLLRGSCGLLLGRIFLRRRVSFLRPRFGGGPNDSFFFSAPHSRRLSPVVLHSVCRPRMRWQVCDFGTSVPSLAGFVRRWY